MIPQTKVCSSCKIEQHHTAFDTRNSGKHLRTKCKKCLNAYEYSKYSQKRSYKERLLRNQHARLAKVRHDRANNINRHRYILEESRKQDKKRRRACDLDSDFVKDLIGRGCAYCKTSADKCKMTLDRINNAIGHVKSNVVPSCTNCNLTRGSMPYDAWAQYVAPAMQAATQSGLLQGWKVNKFA